MSGPLTGPPISLNDIKAEFGLGDNLLNYQGAGGAPNAPLGLLDFIGLSAIVETTKTITIGSYGFKDIVEHGYITGGGFGSMAPDTNAPNFATTLYNFKYRWDGTVATWDITLVGEYTLEQIQTAWEKIVVQSTINGDQTYFTNNYEFYTTGGGYTTIRFLVGNTYASIPDDWKTNGNIRTATIFGIP